MHPVNSSNLASVGYENGVLRIAFHSGDVYDYYNVPETVYNALISAESKGTFAHRYIYENYRQNKII